MRQPLRRYSPKLAVAFLLAIAALFAQDVTDYLTKDVLRVGERLACRCGGCRNNVGNCPMLHCDFADPMRRRIAGMQSQGMSDDPIVASIARADGVVALVSPPASGFGLFTWVMPGIALIAGFFIYTAFVRRNRKPAEPLTADEQALIERFRPQIDRDFEESERKK